MGTLRIQIRHYANYCYNPELGENHKCYIQEETREAAKVFQLDQGEPQTGRIDDRLLLELSQAVAER